MRPLLLLLVLGLSYAQFAIPPLDELMANNTAAAAALEGYYNSSFAQNGTLMLRIGSYSQPAGISASAIIIGLSPSIDNLSCAADGMGLVSARGHEEGHLTALPSPGYPDFYCDSSWFNDPGRQYEWRCDFDGDNCAEYENRTIVTYDANVTFAFRNVTESVRYGSTYAPIPPAIMAELGNASGAENLSVNISGNVTFLYEINDRIYGGDCTSNFTNVSGSVPISVNATFAVGGHEKLFFMVAPILREQWFRSNRFDMVVLSQCPLYRAEILMNNESASNITLRDFNLTTDEYGFMRMVSNLSASPEWSEYANAVANPLPMEARNNSFAFAYRFNHTYAGMGESNLSLIVDDSALNSSQFDDTLLSRMLSFGGNTTEFGLPSANTPSRPSAAFGQGSLTRLEIGLGLVGLVLILAFLNFWIPR
jgi:hypothetical protein